MGLGLVLFFLLLPAALIGWNANLRHLDTWAHLVLSSADNSTATPGFEKDTHSVRNQCLGNALYRLGNFAAYMVAGGPEDPLVDDDNPPPRLMDSPSVDTCLLFVRITLAVGLAVGGGCRLGRSSREMGARLSARRLALAWPVRRCWSSRRLRGTIISCFSARPCCSSPCGSTAWAATGGSLLAIVPGVLVLLQYILLPYVGRIGLLGLGNTAWVMAAMVLMDRTSRSLSAAASRAECARCTPP